MKMYTYVLVHGYVARDLCDTTADQIIVLGQSRVRGFPSLVALLLDLRVHVRHDNYLCADVGFPLNLL